jgi:hypothetical protein
MKEGCIWTIGKRNLRRKRKSMIRLTKRDVKIHSDIFIDKLVYDK